MKGPFYGNEFRLKTHEIVSGYVRIIVRQRSPNVIIGLIMQFYGRYRVGFFNVYDSRKKNIVLNECIGIFINKNSLHLIDKNDKLNVYGYNKNCQLGFKLETTNMYIATKHHPYFDKRNVLFVSQGMYNDHIFVNTVKGLYVCGGNKSNQCGIKKIKDQINKPFKMKYKFKGELTQISCGYKHTLFLTSNGNVYGCGGNNFGQLSNKYTKDNGRIQCIIKSNNIKCIGCCYFSSYILNRHNKLCSFGYNESGELGINDKKIKHARTAILAVDGENIDTFSCGSAHIGCLRSNNKLWMYGQNCWSQCGIDGSDSCHDGKQILYNHRGKIISVKCGGNHTIYKTDTNKYLSFGCNDSGQLLCNLNKHTIYKPQFIYGKCIHKITQSNMNDVIDIIPSCNNTFIITQESS